MTKEFATFTSFTRFNNPLTHLSLLSNYGNMPTQKKLLIKRPPRLTKQASAPRTPSKAIRRTRPSYAVAERYSTLRSNDYIVERDELCITMSNAATTPFVLIPPSSGYPGLDLNPGNAVLFPWLAGVAKNYEKYRFEKLSFHLSPRNPTTTTGSVYMALDYDWDDAPAASATIIMANSGAIATSVWAPATLVVDCARLNQDMPYRYVADALRSGDSQRSTYAGFLMVGLAGTSAQTSFELTAHYRIRLACPCIPDAVASATTAQTMTLAAGAATGLQLAPVGGLPVSISNTGGTPMLYGFPAGTQCYAVSPSTRGVLSTGVAAVSANAPSTYAADTATDYAGFDAAGNQLFTTVPPGASPLTGATYQGPASAASWSSAGGTGKMVNSISTLVSRGLYQTLAYLVPYVVSQAGRSLLAGSSLVAKYAEL